MQVVVLAAGRGTRLHPFTLQRSKAMIPILGKPMIGRVLETLLPHVSHASHVQGGANDNRVIIVVSDADTEIRPYFAGVAAAQPPIIRADKQIESPAIARAVGHEVHASPLPFTPTFVVQLQRLGMGNALQCAAHLIDGPFIVSACDNMTSIHHVAELVAMYQRNQGTAVLSLMEVDWESVSRTGIVQIDGDRIMHIVEKPARNKAPSNIASLPLYLFSRQFLSYLPRIKPSPRGEYEIQDAIQFAIDDGAGVFGVHARSRHQITNASDLLALNLFYLDNAAATVRLAPNHVGKHTHLVTPLYIEEGTEIGNGSVIGPRVFIERDCTIGSHVHIRDAVILRNSTIADGQSIRNQVVSSA